MKYCIVYIHLESEKIGHVIDKGEIRIVRKQSVEKEREKLVGVMNIAAY